MPDTADDRSHREDPVDGRTDGPSAGPPAGPERPEVEPLNCESLDFSATTPLRDVLEAEWSEVRTRRAVEGRPLDQDVAGRPRNLAGLALSGGGIRSATFCLGLLQEFERCRLLERFDYLSTVSGGGFVGAWWSAWLARKGTGLKGAGLFPPREKIEPERESVYQKIGAMAEATPNGQKESEGSVHAGVDPRTADPIHHLRLFSNYLTPRKGALSGDTWRAAAVITRNLLMTWLILVPVLIAAVWIAQLYFVVHPDSRDHFAARLFAPESSEAASPTGETPRECSDRRHAPLLAPQRVLMDRLWAAGTVLFPLGAMMGLMIVLWLGWSRDRWTPGDAFLVVATGAGAAALAFLAVKVALPTVRETPSDGPGPPLVLLSLAALLVGFTLRRPGTMSSRMDLRQLRRNQIIRVHAFLLVTTTMVASVLALAGFGHVLVEYVSFSARSGGGIATAVARAGGWGSVLLALAGMVYTGVVSAPTAGGEATRTAPSRMRASIFSLTPPLVVVVLGVLAAWAGHRLLTRVMTCPSVQLGHLLVASAIGVVLLLCLAIYEFHPPQRWKSILLAMLAIGTVIGGVFVIHDYSVAEKVTEHRSWRVALAVVAGALILFRTLVVDDWKANPSLRLLKVRFLRGRPAQERYRWLALLAFGITVLAAVAFVLLHQLLRSATTRPTVSLAVLAGFLICIVISVFELRWGRGDNQRSLGLLGAGYAIIAVTALAGLWPDWHELQAVVGLIGAVLAWVVAFGWMADPNALSLHNFYKMRLVRAYLGASNDQRVGKEITESALGDDVRLAELDNCAKGAPYHLINTTLNLVGGRDLVSAQRSAVSFTLSKLFCGCPRTGYRPTRHYMCGTLSLGTAVAISGAAASPNQGALSPTAARAILMTLLNVRLGFWAPTPDQPHWMASQARLWPFYMLREALSQTNDLLPYCYLTDGGHFDNTGLYALVERGCRLIVLADCGGDSDLSFGDLGDTIRRCRIDFGTEVKLDLTPLTKASPDRHFVVGTIRYSLEHAGKLRWTDDEANDLEGKIVVVKPILTGEEPVDIRYYRRQSPTFPQQSTSDQFFTEAQFESYRQLGALSAQTASTTIGQALGIVKA